MRAVGLYRYLPAHDPSCLLDLDVVTPEAKGRDLLVRVEAVSVNPVDTKVRAPKDGAEPAPRILGWDAAGVVEAVGEQVSLFKPGDAVFYAGDISRPGSNSEYHLVDERITARKPSKLDWAQAAALPLVSITAYEALFDRLGFDPGGTHRGQTLLILGGAGGVGSMGIQLAKLAGLRVLATASRGESREWVLSLGADHVLDHRLPLGPQIEVLGLPFVEAIANFVDTDAYWDAMADLIKPQGKICTIVDHKRPLDHRPLKAKSVTHVWEFMFTRPKFQTPDMVEQHRLLARVAGWIDEGRLKGILRERFSPICAATLRAAHQRLESGTMIGKLVVERWD